MMKTTGSILGCAAFAVALLTAACSGGTTRSDRLTIAVIPKGPYVLPYVGP